MPYGIQVNPDNTLTVFNREYQPLGVNKVDEKLPDGLPIGLTLKEPVSREFWASVAHEGKLKEGVNGAFLLWFYNDATNPTNTQSEKDWDAYFNRLRMVESIRHQSKAKRPQLAWAAEN